MEVYPSTYTIPPSSIETIKLSQIIPSFEKIPQKSAVIIDAASFLENSPETIIAFME